MKLLPRKLLNGAALLLVFFLSLTVIPTTEAVAMQPAAEPAAFTDSDLDVLRSSLTVGVEVLGKKPELPRLLPSDTSVKAAAAVTEKDLPLYFENSDDSAIYVYLPEGAVVSVLEDLDTVFRVSYNNCTGYADAAAFSLFKRSDTFECYGVVDTEELSVYESFEDIDETTEPAATFTGGQRIEVTGFRQGWFAVRSGETVGFVSGDSLDLTLEKEAPKPKPVVQPAPAPAPDKQEEEADTSAPTVTNGSGSDIAAFALQFVGVPYVYGGASPSGFDCSGFTKYVFAQFGVSLPHGATPQLNYGVSVSRDDLQPGDLVFFQGTYATSSAASHCGIYVGGGQFAHSASGGNRGITVSNLSDAYYSRHYLTARRIEL